MSSGRGRWGRCQETFDIHAVSQDLAGAPFCKKEDPSALANRPARACRLHAVAVPISGGRYSKNHRVATEHREVRNIREID